MKVLLIGSGGREHALAWKIIQSPLCDQLICAPGNAGIAEFADIAQIAADDIDGILAFAETEMVDFVVVGPEVPLALGLVDELTGRGILAFGPSERAAQLESSKAFTKDFCARHNIPTARYDIFTSLESARAGLDNFTAPYVLKADGLAAGKGVVIAQSRLEAEAELAEFFSGKFGNASTRVVIEECMQGPEISFFALCDGELGVPFGTAQDHKRAFDGDEGPNTGGMGAYMPVLGFNNELQDEILREIIRPTLIGMARENMPFTGILFAGLMLTAEGPKLIEYNVRFGDPECQILMRGLKSDLLDMLVAAARGELAELSPPVWQDGAFVNIVLAANGYPGQYKKGTKLKGLEAARLRPAVEVFHAGTRRSETGQLVSAGGRVLNITAHGPNIETAVARAYQVIDEDIEWPDGFCRRDIAWQALRG